MKTYTQDDEPAMMDLIDPVEASAFCLAEPRRLLGDTIALIWNDRYHTTDFTPSNLTTWGYHDCQGDMRNGAFGAQIPKLLMRHLPRHYSFLHALIQGRAEQSLAAQGLGPQYTFRRLSPAPKPRILSTRTAIQYVLADPLRFPPIHTNGLGGRWGFFPGFDDFTRRICRGLSHY
ncbi:hypothetical protein B0H14DRAFT_3782789 [Mycena olivaceomarginata]|nr:hypothetical protein B0H14DRAFT_3782789 [Mycena olivaceomarginata]